jgi:hypothetical protein
MCKPFLIRSWADPTREYELSDLDKFREIYRPGFYIVGGTVPEGADFSNDEVASWLHPQSETPPPPPPPPADAGPPALGMTPAVSDTEEPPAVSDTEEPPVQPTLEDHEV